jgi:enamine deaminase RidA (YjgF/YER057c/UK114 family)
MGRRGPEGRAGTLNPASPAGGLVRLNPPERTAPVGAYSHGVMGPQQGQWLYVSGQVGIGADGVLAPNFEGQVEVEAVACRA